MSKELEIYHHLTDFEFAQAKKALKLKTGIYTINHRDVMCPFFKLEEKIKIRNIQGLKKFMPVVYWEEKCLKIGFITDWDEESFSVSNIQGHPKKWTFERKYLLGRVNIISPLFFFKYRLENAIKSGKHTLIR